MPDFNSDPFWIFTIAWWGGVFGAAMAELITRAWHAWLDRPRPMERRLRALSDDWQPGRWPTRRTR